MAVLVRMHRAAGAVLSRDDLIEDCWGGRIVGEDAITRVIGQLRRALAASGSGASLETIPRVGFRLQGATDKRSAGPPADRRQLLISLGAIAAAGGIGGIWYGSRADPLPPAAVEAMARGKAGIIESTPDSIAAATAAYRQAADAAPGAADPWAFFALTCAYQATTADPSLYGTMRSRARAAAHRALAIDPDNGPAHIALVMMLPPDLSLVEFEQALEAARRHDPSSPITAKVIALFHTQVGRAREALAGLEAFEQWAGPNPRTWPIRASTLASLGRDDEADQLFTRSIERWPRHYAVWFPRFKFLMYSGRGERALAMLEDRANRPTGVSDYNFNLCAAQARAIAVPDRTNQNAGLAASLESAARGHGFAENAMLFASHVGALDEAFELAGRLFLHKAPMPNVRFDKAQGRFTNRARPSTYILFEPAMIAMRRDPRIEAVYRGTGLSSYWQQTGKRPHILV
jgi:tetratricopeptide (TPR) repeat protein